MEVGWPIFMSQTSGCDDKRQSFYVISKRKTTIEQSIKKHVLCQILVVSLGAVFTCAISVIKKICIVFSGGARCFRELQASPPPRPSCKMSRPDGSVPPKDREYHEDKKYTLVLMIPAGREGPGRPPRIYPSVVAQSHPSAAVSAR